MQAPYQSIGGQPIRRSSSCEKYGELMVGNRPAGGADTAGDSEDEERQVGEVYPNMAIKEVTGSLWPEGRALGGAALIDFV